MILEFSSFELILSAVVVAMKVLRRVSPTNNIKIAEAVRERSLELYRRFAPHYAVSTGDTLIQAKLVQVKTLEDIAVGATSQSQRCLSARAYLREVKELHEVVKYCLREPTPGESSSSPSSRSTSHYAHPTDSRVRPASPSPIRAATVRMEQEAVDMIATTLRIDELCIGLSNGSTTSKLVTVLEAILAQDSDYDDVRQDAEDACDGNSTYTRSEASPKTPAFASVSV